MIKAAKRAINGILGQVDVNDEDLQTVFIAVESLLNSRPLTTVRGEVNDEVALTRNHDHENLKVNEIFLVIDPDRLRKEWKLERIEAVYSGEHGLVRVLDVKTCGRTLRRSITRLSPLEAHAE